MKLESINVLGVPLTVTDYTGAIAQAKEWATDAARPRGIAAANTHVVALARHEPAYARALAAFDLLLPDGMPLVWVMNRQLATPLGDRVYGPTFMLRCLEATQGPTWSHLLVGGSEELLKELQDRLRTKFPELRLSGAYSPPFGDWPAGEDERIAERVRQSGANFVWVALGCPKQELWYARCRSFLPPAVYIPVGAAFAFHTGRVRQAPLWMQQRGLEWLFRLFTEPKRLWQRYLVYNSLFLIYLAMDFLRRPGKRQPGDSTH